MLFENKNELDAFEEAELISSLNEYTGNEMKNAQFEECLGELKELLDLYMVRIKFVMGKVDQMVEVYTKIDGNGKNLFKIDAEIRKIGIEGNKELSKIHKELAAKAKYVWPKFDKLSSSFSVKYSSVTMEQKEKFEKVLQPYAEFLDGIYNKYTDEEYQQKILDAYDTCYIAARKVGKDDRYVKELFNIVASWYLFMVDIIVYNINDIRYIYRKFGSKDSFIFRILNKDYSVLKNFKFSR